MSKCPPVCQEGNWTIGLLVHRLTCSLEVSQWIISLCTSCWIITGWWSKLVKSLFSLVRHCSKFMGNTNLAPLPIWVLQSSGCSVVEEICIFALWENCWAKMGSHSRQKSFRVLRKGIKLLHFQGCDKQSIEQSWSGKQKIWPRFSKIWEVLDHGTEQEPLTTSTGAMLGWVKIPHNILWCRKILSVSAGSNRPWL